MALSDSTDQWVTNKLRLPAKKNPRANPLKASSARPSAPAVLHADNTTQSALSLRPNTSSRVNKGESAGLAVEAIAKAGWFKLGQNARLAARLTGWRIDIRSDVEESEAAVEAEEALVEEAEYGDVAVETAEEISEEVVIETTNEEEVTE